MSKKTYLSIIIAVVSLFNSPPGIASPLKSDHTDSCYIQHLIRPVECIHYQVPENWQQPTEGTLKLTAIKVGAYKPSSKPPIVILAGGPGQAASDYGAIVNAVFKRANEQHDIILFDQRGTGLSQGIQCQGTQHLPLLSVSNTDQIQTLIKACAKSAPLDVRYLSSDQIIQDLEHLRTLLNVDTFILWGGSYGTRIAQYYVREYEEHVEKLILDAVLPVGTSLFDSASQSADQSLQQVFKACQRDDVCQTSYPDLENKFNTLMKRYRQTPDTIQYLNGKTGQIETALIDGAAIANVIRSSLYRKDRINMIPYLLTQMNQGNFNTLAAMALDTASWAQNTMYLGATLAILCSEELPGSTSERQPTGFAADDYYWAWNEYCKYWPSRNLARFAQTTFNTNVPTLLISGRYDPVTPPQFGQIASAFFTQHRHIIIEQASHTNSPTGCVPRLINAFIVDNNLEFDDQCLDTIKLDPFLINSNGPEATQKSKGAAS